MSTIVILSLFIMLTMTGAMSIVGRGLCQILPYQIRPIGRLFFSPLLGLAIFVILATIHGWFFPFHQGWCVLELLIAVALSLYFIPQKWKLLPYFSIVLPVALIASLNVFFPIFRFNAFNPFNDAFTYLVHSQWLQQHPFSEPAVSSGYFPALSQVTLYQGAAHRMGSSFFFGWVQAIFGIKWSYYVYPATVSLPLIAGSLAVGGAIKFMVKRHRIIALLTSCLLPSLFCGFTFGAAYGFFPQTFGLAFAVGGINLFGSLVVMSCKERKLGKILLHSIPISLVLAAFAFCYNDLLTAMGAGIVLFLLLYGLLNIDRLRYIVAVFLTTLIQSAIIINVEFVRILKNFIHVVLNAANGSFVIGWPVLWHPIEFLANAFGFRTAIGDIWFANHSYLALPLCIAILLIIIYFIAKNLKLPIHPYLLINLCVLLVLLMIFILFRYFKNPVFPGETGITFLQYKATKWASPFCFVLMGAAFCYISKNFRLLSRILPAFLILLIVAGNVQGYTLSESLTTHFLNETGSKNRGFSKLLELRKLIQSLDKDEVIYLSLREIHHKLRQMIAYVLHDRKLASDYTDDGYLVGHLPPNERTLPYEEAKWIIGFNSDKSSPIHFGNVEMKVRPEYEAVLDSITAAYSRETDGKSWWHWTEKSIKLNYHILGKVDKGLKGKLSFLYMPISNDRPAKIVINQRESLLNMKGGWNQFISESFDIDQKDLSIEIISLEPPSQLSNTDTRKASFLVGNVELSLLPEDRSTSF